MIAIAIKLQQEFRHGRCDFIGWLIAHFEGPQRIGGARRPAGLAAPLTVQFNRTFQVGQRQGDRPVERILIDFEIHGNGRS